MMTLAQAQALLPGSELVGGPAAAALRFERVHSDTRSLQPGDLFVALRGERFDAHDFLAQARAAGAVAALAERGLATAGLPGLQVADSLAALQQLAAGWRRAWPGVLVAVTGSNGKTTVTQMAAAIARAWQGPAALATAGNLNNHIGVPLTLLRLRSGGANAHRIAVLELGMNHPGEIAILAGIAAPAVALVNNAQREHQEFMDGVQAVARENGSVFEALPPTGTAVFPAGDAFSGLWRDLAGPRRCLTFALDDATADLCGRSLDADATGQDLALQTPAGDARLRLELPGRHNAHNALAAAALMQAAGAPLAAIVGGLQDCRPVAGRSQVLQLHLGGRPVTLLDDSYNANPDSVRAAIELLATLPGPRWLVLGDMGEVGAQGPAFHAEVGAHARSLGIDCVWAAGPLATHVGATRHFPGVDALLDALDEAPACAAVAVKGSRFMRMERVVQALRVRADAQAGSPTPGRAA
jgi:UDP-N-acetylmuramoyl-tripeptide--D-alanyl-D-alanine ligase